MLVFLLALQWLETLGRVRPLGCVACLLACLSGCVCVGLGIVCVCCGVCVTPVSCPCLCLFVAAGVGVAACLRVSGVSPPCGALGPSQVWQRGAAWVVLCVNACRAWAFESS